MIWLLVARAAAMDLPDVPLLVPDLEPPVEAPRAYRAEEPLLSLQRLEKKRSAEAIVWYAQAAREADSPDRLRDATDRFWRELGPDHPYAGWVGLQRWFAYGAEGDEAEAALEVALADDAVARWARIARARDLLAAGQAELALAEIDGVTHRDAERVRLHIEARRDGEQLLAMSDQLMQSGALTDEDALVVAMVVAHRAVLAEEPAGEAVWAWVSEREDSLMLGDSGVAALVLLGKNAEAVDILTRLVDARPLDRRVPWRMRLQVQLLLKQGNATLAQALRLQFAERFSPDSDWVAANEVDEDVKALIANELQQAALEASKAAVRAGSEQAWAQAAAAWSARLPWGYLPSEAWTAYGTALVRSGQVEEARSVSEQLARDGLNAEAAEVRQQLP